MTKQRCGRNPNYWGALRPLESWIVPEAHSIKWKNLSSYVGMALIAALWIWLGWFLFN